MDLEAAIETEANRRLLAILRSGRWPTEAELELGAVHPAMTGQRLSDLLHSLAAEGWRSMRLAAATQPRIMGRSGGKAPRKDRFKQKRADVLAAWKARANHREGALPWATRMRAQHAIPVAARTAAEWVRRAEPRKRQAPRG
ncbi:MAG: hypothetical protein ACREU3_14250 [Steroidobacteraceae bacterium]